MNYKYIKISHENGDTIGIKTYSDKEDDRASEDPIHRRLHIVQPEAVEGEMIYQPAKLDDGYYPIEHFEEVIIAADYFFGDREVKPKISKNLFEYIGPREEL